MWWLLGLLACATETYTVPADPPALELNEPISPGCAAFRQFTGRGVLSISVGEALTGSVAGEEPITKGVKAVWATSGIPPQYWVRDGASEPPADAHIELARRAWLRWEDEGGTRVIHVDRVEFPSGMILRITEPVRWTPHACPDPDADMDEPEEEVIPVEVPITYEVEQPDGTVVPVATPEGAPSTVGN